MATLPDPIVSVSREDSIAGAWRTAQAWGRYTSLSETGTGTQSEDEISGTRLLVYHRHYTQKVPTRSMQGMFGASVSELYLPSNH